MNKPPARPSVGPEPTVKGDPHHPPSTKVEQDSAEGGSRPDGGKTHREQSKEIQGVPRNSPVPDLDGGGKPNTD